MIALSRLCYFTADTLYAKQHTLVILYNIEKTAIFWHRAKCDCVEVNKYIKAVVIVCGSFRTFIVELTIELLFSVVGQRNQSDAGVHRTRTLCVRARRHLP